MLPIGDPPPLLDLEFERSLSENDEFLDDVLPRDSDLESEDLVWDVEGLVVDPLTELGDDEGDLPRTIGSGGANNLLSAWVTRSKDEARWIGEGGLCEIAVDNCSGGRMV
jgi:hypothetical protein